MKTTQYTPETLPVSITILAGWIDWSDRDRPEFKFTLRLQCRNETMETPYSGGILAFIQWESPKVKKAFQEAIGRNRNGFSRLSKSIELIRSGRMTRKSVADEAEYKEAIEWIFQQSTITPASVCYSLVMDAQSGAESFEDFCGNYGYDEDSRKAFVTYEACQKLGKSFRKLVGEDFDAIAEALQDY